MIPSATPRVIGNHFYFEVRDRPGNPQRWKSDGTPEGTRLTSEIPQLIGGVEFEGGIYFGLSDSFSGTELARYDLETGTTQVVYDHSNGVGSNPENLQSFNDQLFFSVQDTILPELQLWLANEESAVLVNALPAPAGEFEDPFQGSTSDQGLRNFEVLGDELVFSRQYGFLWGSGNAQTEFDLWATNATPEGARLIDKHYVSFFAEHEGYLATPSHQAVIDGKLYYEARDGFEARATDGVTTQRLVVEGIGGISQFHSFDGGIVFSAEIDRSRELWITRDEFETFEQLTEVEQTQEGLTIGSALRLDRVHHSRATEFLQFNDDLYFTAIAGLFSNPESIHELIPNVRELWKTDGTREGTVRVAAPEAGHLADLHVVGDRILFTAGPATEIDDKWRLFSTDGTNEGTVAIGTFDGIGQFVEFDTRVFFSADAGDGAGHELWQSDGTFEGTKRVADINRTVSSFPSDFVVYEDRLLFVATDTEHGREIWSTDGTTDGTALLIDVAGGLPWSDPSSLTVVDDLLYFTAEDLARGRELFRADLDELFAIEPVEGDVNGDHVVDSSDFILLASNFNKRTDQGVEDGDLNEDGHVDLADFILLRSAFAQVS